MSESGVIRQRLSFDAHGSRRVADPPGNTALWNLLDPFSAANANTNSTTRGYTGHEQLDGVGLIHMNARLYDPEIGRFIQADSMVEPEATQGLNRYSYVLNNPLTFTDPTGQLSFRQGDLGDNAVRWTYAIGPRTGIKIGSTWRYPDGLNSTAISEIKNVARQGWDAQLRAYSAYATAKGLQFNLYVSHRTVLSATLQNAQNAGLVNVIRVSM